MITRAKEKLFEWRSKKQMAEEEPAEFEDIKLEIESPQKKVGSPEVEKHGTDSNSTLGNSEMSNAEG